MRVGILTEPIDRKSGSVAVFTENLVKNLIEIVDRKNEPVEIILIHLFQNEHPIYKEAEELVIFPYIKKRMKQLNIFQKMLFDFKFYSKLSYIVHNNNIDVLHLPQYTAAQAPLLNFKKIGNFKLIVTLHGVQPLVVPPTMYPYLKHYFIHELIYSYFNALKWKSKFKEIVDRIVTVSYSGKKSISRVLNISPDKISVVYNGYNDKIFRPYDKNESQKYLAKKYSITKPFIFHLSTHHPNKNVLRIIYAFKLVNPAEYVLVIGGHSKIIQKLKKQIYKLNLEDKVIFTGYIPLSDLPVFYNAADIFIFPSLHEGFGLPVIEAMACGTPVITSNVYATKEIAEGAAILVDPYNTEEIANAISVLLSDSHLRKRLSRKGLIRAKKFSWKKTACKYLEIYKQIGGR